MTETITIKNSELADYGARSMRGEIHLLKMSVLKDRTGYEILWSDAPYNTFPHRQKPRRDLNE